jgi:hypothetical protein
VVVVAVAEEEAVEAAVVTVEDEAATGAATAADATDPTGIGHWLHQTDPLRENYKDGQQCLSFFRDPK